MTKKRKTIAAPKTQRNRPSGSRPAQGGSRAPAARSGAGPDAYWLYGQHALAAALANPARQVRRLVATRQAGDRLARADGPEPEILEREALIRLLPPGAVDQGAAALVEPLSPPALPALLAGLPEGRQVVLALDQVTDPQNVGAILRSAAAFGAAAVLTTQRNAAPESGALAKAASGGLEHVPYLQEPNLAHALEELKAAGFWVAGLAGEAEGALGTVGLPERLALVLGAEGTGLRRLTRERCDLLLRLPTRGALRDLNVSNAAAVALYALLGTAP